MAILKCKMCGGSIQVTGESVAVCDYCGTQQTVPTVQDENLQGLFNRANTLRLKCEFDKAEELYEKIITFDSTLSEAYWGIILCRYGIEYVEDPGTLKRVPTCHRTSYESIIADDDYKQAVENADVSSRLIYEEEAKEIDRLQKEILSLAQKEDNYDVFICYKETDEVGNRTQDSVIANDIYYQLTQEGLKVFFAAISLEDKLGSAYEPCIFAALNSAKVMLVIGTKAEYFNAVWVKNEWSRFLRIMKKERGKILIPCYKNMDAYELPEEFAHLQAQNMSKIGFVNDIVRGIRKIIPKESAYTPTSSVASSADSSVGVPAAGETSLLKRAQLFLEDGSWESAEKYAEKVLDMNPENAMAYVCKLLASLHVSNIESLNKAPRDFKDFDSYKKAVRFADDALKSRLIEAWRARQYNSGLSLMDKGQFVEASNAFSQIAGYRDADSKVNECIVAAEKKEEALYKSAVEKVAAADKERDFSDAENGYRMAIKICQNLKDHQQAKELISVCEERLNKLTAYVNLVNKMRKLETEKGYLECAKRLQAYSGYRNADHLVKVCHEKAAVCHKDLMYSDACRLAVSSKREDMQQASELFSRLAGWKDSNQKKQECDDRIANYVERKKYIRKATVFNCLVGAVVFVVQIVLTFVSTVVAYNTTEESIDVFSLFGTAIFTTGIFFCMFFCSYLFPLLSFLFSPRKAGNVLAVISHIVDLCSLAWCLFMAGFCFLMAITEGPEGIGAAAWLLVLMALVNFVPEIPLFLFRIKYNKKRGY